ncbi:MULTISPECIES: carboxylate--amine ligase [Halorussus]|uniref:carboxylate--amine ligase n=1 Tax=Halorussus TaxID=1070314 RepID=UPI0020A20C5D|nr:carboxylate--amine ligase [Halorussus vallis]USZ76270.1 carboxylate--amine ligase [Halorussus vallis]
MRNESRADGVLVLDGNGQSALAVTRSLGRRGVPVTVASEVERSLGSLSKYADDRFVTPPMDDAEAYLAALRDHLADADYFAVFPVRDETTALCSKHKADLESTGTLVAAEDWETFERAYDKARLFDLADDLSVPTPETRAPESVAACEEIADDMPYPAVVKPRGKTAWDDDGRLHHYRVSGGNYVDSPAELVETFASMVESDPVLASRPPIVQEYVEGTTVTTVGVADGGDLRAHFQEERIRTTPPGGGNSTLLGALSDPRLTGYAREVLGALDWTGPAMVEYMRTPDDEVYLIEVNGRYWGSLPFAVASGVDVPWLHYSLLRGQPISQPEVYRTDVRQHRLLYEDLEWLRAKLDAGELSAIPEFVRTCATAKQTFVSYEDPLPTLGALWQAATTGTRVLADRVGVGSNRGEIGQERSEVLEKGAERERPERRAESERPTELEH